MDDGTASLRLKDCSTVIGRQLECVECSLALFVLVVA